MKPLKINLDPSSDEHGLPPEAFEFHEPHEPKLEELTCFKCPLRETCEFVDDPYNTNGDCLASK